MRRVLAPCLALIALLGCAALTSQDRIEVATYEGQQMACIADNAGDEAAIDECRARVARQWDAQWNARFDGGFSDAGGDR